MSQEYIKIGKRLNAAFNRGDVEAGLAFFAADAEFRDLLNTPSQDTAIRGIDGIREVIFLWSSEFDELRSDIKEWIDAGDHLIVKAHWHGHGNASGVSVDSHQFDHYEFSAGMIVRATLGYRTKEAALGAAGLSP